MADEKESMGMIGAIIAFIVMGAIGVMIFGAIPQFVLGIFGVAVTFGQACGIGFVLGIIWGAVSGTNR